MIRSAIVAARPSGYHANAVQFDGTTWALIAALAAAADNGKATASIWIKATEGTPANGQEFWVGGDGSNYLFLYPPDGGNSFETLFGGGGNDTGADWAATFGVWLNVIQSADLSGATPHFAQYSNDAPVGTPFTDGTFPSTMNFNGSPFAVGASITTDSQITCDMADFQLWSGLSIAETGNTIMTANRRLFISAAGKPVDPTVAQTAFGTPTLRLNGNAATWTSLLIGYGFTITGVLTNASTSPSD